MGFFQSCWELLVSFATFTTFNGQDRSQQPLAIPLPGAVVHPHSASPGFSGCHYPSLRGWKGCNSPNDRGCWLRDPKAYQPLWTQYDINTDYEKLDRVPPGIEREYWLEVDSMPLSPDGYLKPLGKVFNNSYPGPLIEACWGDDITVHVTNKLSDNGTTIHWHGIRQLFTNEMDGVNGVTQCPIAQNDTFTYRFKARQYGHSWYHSHYSLQYPDGVAGPLLIHGPSSAEWDEAWDPIMVNDWVHESAFAVFQQELQPGIPVAQSILLGGTGHYNCSSSDSRCCSSPNADPRCSGIGAYFTRTFVKGKRYLIRLINASAEAMFIFSIDGHKLKVISTDFVPIEPYLTDSLFIGIGQRYSVIVEASPDVVTEDGNYWIRTHVADQCGIVEQPDERTGIIRYNNLSLANPTSTTTVNRTKCEDEPFESLIPKVYWPVGRTPENDPHQNTYEASFEGPLNKTRISHGALRWDLTDYPLWLNFSDPTILNLENKTWNPEYCVEPYDYKHGWVYLIITGQAIPNTKKPLIPAAHPIHLHGHDFAIIAQKNASYNESYDPAFFNFDNPPRRDVAMLFSGGYLALAFRPDNPGVWLVHCHIAWHASSGLALQILERQEDILDTIGSLAQTADTCRRWDQWGLKYDQDDSGI